MCFYIIVARTTDMDIYNVGVTHDFGGISTVPTVLWIFICNIANSNGTISKRNMHD